MRGLPEALVERLGPSEAIFLRIHTPNRLVSEDKYNDTKRVHGDRDVNRTTEKNWGHPKIATTQSVQSLNTENVDIDQYILALTASTLLLSDLHGQGSETVAPAMVIRAKRSDPLPLLQRRHWNRTGRAGRVVGRS